MGVMALCRGCDPRVGGEFATMPMQNSQVYFYPYIYAQATNNPKKVEKINVNFSVNTIQYNKLYLESSC